MEEVNVAVIAGQTITVGVVASFLAQVLKVAPWFPIDRGNKVGLRLLVGVLCAAINAGVAYFTIGELPVVEVLINSLLSYVSAAANFDHVFKN